jgi:hypothetical protein
LPREYPTEPSPTFRTSALHKAVASSVLLHGRLREKEKMLQEL